MMNISLNKITQMTREEKLQLMEALWADLSRSDADLKSPDWHEEALSETEQRLAAGNEELVEWDEAKLALRKRFD